MTIHWLTATVTSNVVEFVTIATLQSKVWIGIATIESRLTSALMSVIEKRLLTERISVVSIPALHLVVTKVRL